jgi:hypothetical protein
LRSGYCSDLTATGPEKSSLHRKSEGAIAAKVKTINFTHALVGVSRFVADSEIAVSTTKLMAGTDAAPLLSYLGD